MHLFKFPPPSYFHTLLLFLVTSFIFTGCKKNWRCNKERFTRKYFKTRITALD